MNDYEVLRQKVDAVAANVKELDTKLGIIITLVKEVPSQFGAMMSFLKTINTNADYLKEVVGKLRVESNPAASPPEQWILRCVAVDTDEDDEDDEYRFFAGTVTDTGKVIWTTDWHDALRYSSVDSATEAAAVLAKDGMPKTPVGCHWKIWTQPVLFGKAGKLEYIENQYRFWTQVYPKSYPASRS